MKCPMCADIELVRTPYEGIGIDICPSCHCFLLSEGAIKNIERNPAMQQDVLESETQQMADTNLVVTCPKCRIEMQKESAPHDLGFNIDVCRFCNLIWLDSGELESMQLAYEASPIGKANILRRQAMENMSEERKRHLKENIDKAPDHMPMFDDDNSYFSGSSSSSTLFHCLIDILLR
jgi:Zn-finger nucleic acid-binding protein